MTKNFTTDLRVGETIKIGDAAVTVGDKSGRMVRLHVAAPGAVKLAKEATARNAHSHKAQVGPSHEHDDAV